MPTAKPESGEDLTQKIARQTVARVRMEPDGTLSSKRLELVAVVAAEGHPPQLAWLAVDKMLRRAKGLAPIDARASYRNGMLGCKAFKQRLETLMAEREELVTEEKGVWGRLEFQANQIYRAAAAQADIAMMERATNLLLKVATKSAPDKPEAPPRPVGAPAVETPDLAGESRSKALAEQFLTRAPKAPAPADAE